MKKKLIMLMLFVLGTLLLSQGAVAGVGDGIGSAIGSIIDVGRLNFLYGTTNSPDSDLIGFIRILLGIIVFTILYAISSVFGKYMSKNIAVTISVVMSIIVTIGMPSAILTTFATTWSAFFAFIIVGLPLLACFWLIVRGPFPDERFWTVVKMFILGFVTWSVGLINAQLTNLGAGIPSAAGLLWGDFGKYVDMMTEYAYLLAVGLFIYLVIKLASGNAEESSKKKEWGLKSGDKIVKALGSKAKKGYKRSKTKTLNQYYEDELEIKTLERARVSIENATLLIKNVRNAGEIQKNHWVNAIVPNMDAVNQDLEDAHRRFRQVKSRTYRQQREAKRLIRELERNKEIEKKDVTSLEAIESSILKKHQESLDALNDAIDTEIRMSNQYVDYINKRMKPRTAPLKNLDTENVPKTTSTETATTALNTIEKNLQLVVSSSGNLTKAIKAEEEAMKMLKGFIAKVEKYW